MKSFVTFGLATIIACSSLTVGNAFVINNNKRVVSIQTLSSLQMTLLRYGEKKKDFPAGSPLKNACASLGVKPKYSCKLGDCGSCTLSVGGNRMKPCVGKVPPEPKLKSLLENGLEIK